MSCDTEAEEEREAAIAAALTEPKRFEADGVVAESRPISEMIEADRYLKSKCASSGASRGLRITKLVPPGAV